MKKEQANAMVAALRQRTEAYEIWRRSAEPRLKGLKAEDKLRAAFDAGNQITSSDLFFLRDRLERVEGVVMSQVGIIEAYGDHTHSALQGLHTVLKSFVTVLKRPLKVVNKPTAGQGRKVVPAKGKSKPVPAPTLKVASKKPTTTQVRQ